MVVFVMTAALNCLEFVLVIVMNSPSYLAIIMTTDAVKYLLGPVYLIKVLN